jgi:membrane-associated protease RseP (regulator of RpoE activity)
MSDEQLQYWPTAENEENHNNRNQLKRKLGKFWSSRGPLIMLLLTIMTTFTIGLATADSFIILQNEISGSSAESNFWSFSNILSAAIYTLALLGFLAAHEMGHYLTCKKYEIRSTLPWFLPNPLFFGTFGAVIRIKSPIRSKNALFDVGISGPLAGFIVAVPILFIGLLQSLSVPVDYLEQAANTEGMLILGDPLLLKIIGNMLFENYDSANIVLSPLGLVGWFACLVTAINLLPVAQLDGGHIVYALVGKKQYFISIAVVVSILALSVIFDYYGWLLWCLLVVLMRLRHPPVQDESVPLDRNRKLLALAALAIFVLCFVPVPIVLQ